MSTILDDFPVAGLAIDRDGTLIVADAGAGRILRIDATGPRPHVAVLASNLGLLQALALGADGSIYIASSRTSPGAAADWRAYRLRP